MSHLNLSDDDLDTICDSVAHTIDRLRAEGTTGMSFENLRQLVSMRGLRCSASALRANFDLLAQRVADNAGFNLYESE